MKIDQIRDDSISCDICGEERPLLDVDEVTYLCAGDCGREGFDCCIPGTGALCNDCEDIEQENYDEEYEYDEDDEDTEDVEDDDIDDIDEEEL